MQRHKDILNELEETGSKLGAYPQKMPYDTPEDYFRQLPGQVSAMINAIQIADGLPKDMPFETPVEYFDQLPTIVLESVKKEERNHGNSIPFITTRNTQLAAAAIFFLLIGAGMFRFNHDSLSLQLDALSDHELREYLSQTSGELHYNSIGDGNIHFPDQLSDKELTQYLNETVWQ